MFLLTPSYKGAVADLATYGLQFDPMSAPGLSDPPNELGSYSYNALEGVAAKIYCLDRALHILPTVRQFEMAQDRLRDVFLKALGRDYNSHEISSLILPLFEKRHGDYEAAFGKGKTPGDHISSLCRSMIDNFVHFEDVDDMRKLAATPYLAEGLLLEPARRVKGMLGGPRKVRW